jgi:hypothetical protein
MGKYFHFSKNARAEKPAIPRKILVHADTAQGKQALQRRTLMDAAQA